MINSIIEGISISLNAEFGDNYTTYTESVEQGLKEPCFFCVLYQPNKPCFPWKAVLQDQSNVYSVFPG